MEVTEPADLYALELDEFVPARDALAKRLRKDGDREAADAVKALRKPSRPAWAINRLARDEPGLVAALLEAGAELREAQAAALAGDADARDTLRAATAGQRTAVGDLVAAARELDAEPAMSAAALERVRETLQSAAGHPELAEAIGAGRLTEEIAAGGEWPFGAAEAAPEKSRAEKPAKPKKRAPEKRDEAAERRRREADEKATAAERERALKEARRAQKAAQKELDRAERALATATARREELDAEAARAAEHEAEQRERAGEARAAAEAAQAAVDEL